MAKGRKGIFVYDPVSNREWLVGAFSPTEEGVNPESVWAHAEMCLAPYKPNVEICIKNRY